MTGPTDHRPGGATARPASDARARRPVLGVTLLVLGAVPTAAGAALLTLTLTSPPNLATGIVQAAALIALVVGLLLVTLGSGPMAETYRHGGRTTLLVAAAALVVGALVGGLT